MAGKLGTYVRDHHLALLCLFLIVGGGTAWAAGLAKDSVKSKHIKDGQVKTLDLADDAVDAAKIKDIEALGGEVLVLNDNNLGDGFAVNSGLIAVGAFDFQASCEQGPAGAYEAQISLFGPSNMSIDSNGENSDNSIGQSPASAATLIGVGPTQNPNVRTGSFGAIADQGASSLTGEVVAGTEIQGADCAFAFSASG